MVWRLGESINSIPPNLWANLDIQRKQPDGSQKISSLITGKSWMGACGLDACNGCPKNWSQELGRLTPTVTGSPTKLQVSPHRANSQLQKRARDFYRPIPERNGGGRTECCMQQLLSKWPAPWGDLNKAAWEAKMCPKGPRSPPQCVHWVGYIMGTYLGQLKTGGLLNKGLQLFPMVLCLAMEATVHLVLGTIIWSAPLSYEMHGPGGIGRGQRAKHRHPGTVPSGDL